IIFPAMMAMLPGIKLTYVTAMVPILNVALASKEIVSGTVPGGPLLVVYISLFVLAAGSLYFCTQWFKREDVIFRGI
ncbi:MAG: ABC transporter permease, partial [bacterium]|nr:ABC transporter permease [bacterium]